MCLYVCVVLNMYRLNTASVRAALGIQKGLWKEHARKNVCALCSDRLEIMMTSVQCIVLSAFIYASYELALASCMITHVVQRAAVYIYNLALGVIACSGDDDTYLTAYFTNIVISIND